MSRVRSSGSQMEQKLGRALWALGIRYRKQYKKLIGRPDFVVVKARIAIFCDSSFWHGRDWDVAKGAIKSNKEFWIPKIERNIMRDNQVNMALAQAGWKVLRFWDKDIQADAAKCASEVLGAINGRLNGGEREQSNSS